MLFRVDIRHYNDTVASVRVTAVSWQAALSAGLHHRDVISHPVVGALLQRDNEQGLTYSTTVTELVKSS
jgi:hypothetical protein